MIDHIDIGVALAIFIGLGGLAGLAALINSRTTGLTAIANAQAAYIKSLEERITALEADREQDQETIVGLQSQITVLAEENRRLKEEIATLRQSHVQPPRRGR